MYMRMDDAGSTSLLPTIPFQRLLGVVWHVASVQDTHSTQPDQAGPERDFDVLDKRRKNGQKKTQRDPEKKTRICNSNPFIPEGLVKQLLAIALVHFNVLTGPQLLGPAPAAAAWSGPFPPAAQGQTGFPKRVKANKL